MLRFLKYLTQKDIKPMGDQLLENNILKSLQKMIRLIRIPKFDTKLNYFSIIMISKLMIILVRNL